MKIENPKDQYELSECREILAERFPKIGNRVRFIDDDNIRHVGSVISIDLTYENKKLDEFCVGMVVLEFPDKMVESFMLTVEDEWHGPKHDEYGMDLYLHNRYGRMFAYDILQQQAS